MFGMKMKWYFLFESVDEMEEHFMGKNTVVHRTMFGEALLVKDNGKYLAFKNKCPHQGKPMDDCRLEKGNVICPFHQYHFSIETGRGHGLYLEKYELRIDARGVFLGKEVWSLF
jgi:nitrite reductase/ring-hydroxylating ferredoxin subunit